MQVEIVDLACRRAGRMVFRGTDFTLARGQAGQLRGPNGVGKSTLLRVLAGLIPAAAGRIEMGGADLTADLAGRQDLVAYAGHLDAIKPALTLSENLSTWAMLFGGTGTDVTGALARFDLEDIADRPAGQCSAGQKRRLGLARLLVADRPLWLLDEPTVSLDSHSAALVAELVGEHCTAGGSALIATHIDLALPPGPVLTMTPAAAPPPEEADAFLSGEWA